MDFKKEYDSKLISAKEAAAMVKMTCGLTMHGQVIRQELLIRL